MSLPEHLTLCYKKAEDLSILLDVFSPLEFSTPSNTLLQSLVPALVYFHGGGLTVGSRESWFPFWLQKRVVAMRCAFISADYRLIPPATGSLIVDDLKDLFAFLDTTEISMKRESSDIRYRIDPNAIIVSGSSSGGLCAYLAASHCTPKPKAVLSLYGMGGNFFSHHYLTPKREVFFRGRELLDPTDFSEFLYPFSPSLQPTAASELSYHPATYRIPGYPSNPRMLLGRLYLQLGCFLDYFTGEHEPSISGILRKNLSVANNQSLVDEHAKTLVPAKHHPLFPQFGITSTWPPTMLLHGSVDSAVLVQESQHLHDLLEAAGVPVQLVILPGKEHSFDYELGAEEELSPHFDTVSDFLRQILGV